MNLVTSAATKTGFLDNGFVCLWSGKKPRSNTNEHECKQNGAFARFSIAHYLMTRFHQGMRGESSENACPLFVFLRVYSWLIELLQPSASLQISTVVGLVSPFRVVEGD